jgi:predicted MFS family arabinose efflux permease
MALCLRPRFILAPISGSLCYFSYTALEPVLAIRLQDFDLSSIEIGVFFSLYALLYIPGGLLVQYTPARWERRSVLLTAILLAGCACLFIGPSELLPNSLALMVIGQAWIGIVTPFMLVPCLGEMVDSQLPLFPE